MTEINQITNLFKNFNGIKFTTRQQEAETLLSSSTMDIDSVDLNSNKSEKFEDVFAEFEKNIPDSTSTITEKELAISYIDRMLACDNISDDLKVYWQNKKSVIQMEIQNIKNEEKSSSIGNKKTFASENVNDVWNEYEKFVKKYQKFLNNSLSAEDKYEYLIIYNRTGLSFVARLMKCSDITNEQMLAYKKMYSNFQADIKNARLDFLSSTKEKS